LWINDVTPPTVKLLGYANRVVRLAVSDTGSGVAASVLEAYVDNDQANVTFKKGIASVQTGGLAPGKHDLEFFAVDFQETKNMEDVSGILPNTRDFTATFTVP